MNIIIYIFVYYNFAWEQLSMSTIIYNIMFYRKAYSYGVGREISL